MDRDEIAKHFDRLCQAASDSRADAGIDNCQSLPLRPAPKAHLWPAVRRSMREVDPKLVAVFRELATGTQPWPLFLYGPVGAGKSLAALCLCDFTETSAMMTVEELCRHIMAGDPMRSETLDRIERKDLLVLDELGTRQSVGDLEYMTIKNVLDTRHRIGRSLIAISNHSPEVLTGIYDRRIVSRLTAGTIYHLQGDDRRVRR